MISTSMAMPMMPLPEGPPPPPPILLKSSVRSGGPCRPLPFDFTDWIMSCSLENQSASLTVYVRRGRPAAPRTGVTEENLAFIIVLGKRVLYLEAMRHGGKLIQRAFDRTPQYP